MLSLALTSGSAAFAQSPAKAPQDRPIPVRVATAAPSAEASLVISTGTVLYKREVALSFKTGGVVKAYAVDVGDEVRAGQALVNADPTDVSGRRGEAEAAFAQAKANLERAQQLAAGGFASEARVEDAKTAFQRAQAALNSAKFDETRAALSSPTDGVVLIRHAEAGQQMAPGAPVVTIGDARSGLIMQVPISDRDIVRIRSGDTVRVRMAGLGRTALTGRVTRLAAKADRVSGAFDVEVTLDAPPQGLRSGLIAEAAIAPTLGNGSEALLAIPAIALLEGRGDIAYVFRIDAQGVATRVAVVVERLFGENALIRQGLKAGDQVVTAGAPYLRNGQRVAIAGGGGQ